MDKPIFETLEERVLLSVTPYLPGDANQDDVVGIADLTAVADNYGRGDGQWTDGDFNADGIVGIADLAALADRYGQRCLAAAVALTNSTYVHQTDWPVFLTVWQAFGPNMDPGLLRPDGFHVFDADGTALRATIRRIPPEFSVGSDEIVFVVPHLGARETRTVRVINVDAAGCTDPIDLAGDPHNLIPNGGFEAFAGSVPTGYTVRSNNGVAIAADE